MTIEQIIDEIFEAFETGEVEEAKRLITENRKEVSAGSEDEDQLLHAAGYIYIADQNLDKAREVYETLYEHASSPEDKHIALHQLGAVERMDSEFDKAEQLFEEEANLLKEYFPGDDIKLADNQFEQGYVYMLKGDYKAAEEQLKSSLALGQSAKDELSIATAHRALGELNAAQEQMEEAKLHFTEAKKNFSASGDDMSVQEIEMLETVIFEK